MVSNVVRHPRRISENPICKLYTFFFDSDCNILIGSRGRRSRLCVSCHHRDVQERMHRSFRKLWGNAAITVNFNILCCYHGGYDLITILPQLLQSCIKRIEKKGSGDCEAWYFDYYKCIDKCVSYVNTQLFQLNIINNSVPFLSFFRHCISSTSISDRFWFLIWIFTIPQRVPKIFKFLK
jgi:Ubiquinol-cytochrome C reductase hinge protein